MVSGRINIWIGKSVHEEARKLNINISQEFRDWLTKKLGDAGTIITLPTPDINILVGCIHCGNAFSTTNIGQVRCPNCQKTFRVYTKKGSRIKKILKGDLHKLNLLYAKKFRKSLW